VDELTTAETDTNADTDTLSDYLAKYDSLRAEAASRFQFQAQAYNVLEVVLTAAAVAGTSLLGSGLQRRPPASQKRPKAARFDACWARYFARCRRSARVPTSPRHRRHVPARAPLGSGDTPSGVAGCCRGRAR
jgi:hypothetical protein